MLVMFGGWFGFNQLLSDSFAGEGSVSNLLGSTHRYLKSKIDCLRFVMSQLLAQVFQSFFFFFCGGH